MRSREPALRRTGAVYPLQAAATRIGRLTDNDIVLDDANVSRHHAVIIDTGTSFVITDLRSANGVDVGGERIRGTATLADGDRIRICDHEFTFEIAAARRRSRGIRVCSLANASEEHPMSDPERESRVGSQIGPYRLRRLLGKGGMGEVYEAEDTVKDRIVALKLLPEAVSHDPVFRKRLQREAHSAGRLQEPHVVPIHDYGEIDGLLYVDMRMIDGTDLRKMLKRYGPMTPARAVAIVRQVASALDAAHESGVMHRDVKPENILITRDDFAYLVDFGIANAATDEKLTELGTAVGTYAYMAPERFTNDEVTYRADVYALTCVLHECLTGSQPYQRRQRQRGHHRASDAADPASRVRSAPAFRPRSTR